VILPLEANAFYAIMRLSTKFLSGPISFMNCSQARNCCSTGAHVRGLATESCFSGLENVVRPRIILPRPTLRLRPFLDIHKIFTEFRPDFPDGANLPIGAIAARGEVPREVDGPRCRVVIANQPEGRDQIFHSMRSSRSVETGLLREVEPIARQTAA
jgi:hypothetical protein